MKIDIVSIFPAYFEVLGLSLLGKARDRGLLEVGVHDLRDVTTDKHRTVDGTPAGGGAGMVMKPEPWGIMLDQLLAASPCVGGNAATANAGASMAESTGDAECAAGSAADVPGNIAGAEQEAASEIGKGPLLIFPSPAGEVFNQRMARELAAEQHLIFGCGRYEGIDQRVFDEYEQRARVKLISIGDYVLNGGEVATIAMIEAIARLLPGMVGNPESLVEESHEDGLLEYPSYTQPAMWRDRAVPEVLLSGNHRKIAEWRHEQRIARTKRVRPELLTDQTENQQAF